MKTVRPVRLLLGIILSVLISPLGAAHGRPGVSLGIQNRQWKLDDGGGTERGMNLRLRAGSHFAIQLGYQPIRIASEAMTPTGFALPPDVRGAMIITPLPNRYFAPYLALGAGKARYAEGRIILTAGVGVEIRLQSWLVIDATWTVLAPDPFAVAAAIEEQRATDLAMGPENVRPIDEMIREHYSLDATEISAGFRLTY